MPLFLFLFFLLMVGYAILISYYHKAWNDLPSFTAPEKQPSVIISVVIAVRNEEKNIQPLIESLYQQSYSKQLFQVVVVDDHSTDNTWNTLKNIYYPDLALTATRLSLSEEERKNIKSFKKMAIATGINLARGALIVTTDADCRFHPDWLITISSFYENKQAKFIAAPVVMEHRKGLLALFQSLDFISLQGITAASVNKRFHSMCNGANLAYEKEAFLAVNGFEGVDGIASGDDMLLMHKIYQKYPDQVYYLKNKSAIVTTEPSGTWKEFFQQRIRWASKADRYDDKRIFWVLLGVYILNACFLATAIASFWKNIWLFFFCILLLAKILIEFPFVNSVAIFFGRQALMKYFPLLQPLHILYTLVAGWLGKFGHYEWKGRRIERK